LDAVDAAARRIADPRLRATFFAGIPENHGILGLAALLGIRRGA